MDIIAIILGMIDIVAAVTVYLFVFRFFQLDYRLKFDRLPVPVVRGDIVLYLIVIAIGLKFFRKPLTDFSLIMRQIQDGVVIPYKHFDRDMVTLVYMSISSLIVAPIFEEIIFRKNIFKKLCSRYSLTVAIIVSSSCFALVHISSLTNLIPTFIFGVVCCLMYVKTKRIIYPILLHFFGNFIWFLLAIFGESYYTWLYNQEFGFMYWALVVFGALLIILGLKQITTSTRFYKQQSGIE